jgi:hypothetical protein
MADSDTPAAATPAAMQAVVVIHGMGEQRPMDTIKGFVRAVWETDDIFTKDPLPNPTQVWSKPDGRTGSLELRRITTRESIPSEAFRGGVRTDFYELYWADLTAGSRWDQFTGWVRGLLFRRPAWLRWWPFCRLPLVPPGLTPAWVALWVATLLVVALGAAAAIPGWHWVFGVLSLALLAWVHKKATATFGRVVRYTKADPDNIAARAAVRERGLKLLNALHEGDYYKRIIIVSHSLGTMFGLDLLSYFWAERDAARKIDETSPEFDALAALETAAAAVPCRNPTPEALANYYAAQRQLRQHLAARPLPDPVPPPGHTPADPRWLISDFVTLGSPLTHADFLIAASEKDLEQRKIERELCTSPPFREELDPHVRERAEATHKLPVREGDAKPKLISFPPPWAPRIWELHHAAPFAVVRWTNIYDTPSFIYRGDLIGGPLAKDFGPAIVDIDLKSVRGPATSFTHTKYWELDGEPKHIEVLRKAVNLLDKANP